MNRVIRLYGTHADSELGAAMGAAAEAYKALVRTKWTFTTFATMEDHALVIRCVPVETPDIPDELAIALGETR